MADATKPAVVQDVPVRFGIAVLRCAGASVPLISLLAFTPAINAVAGLLQVQSSKLVPAPAAVVLGGGLESDGSLSAGSVLRIAAAADLYRQGLTTLVVFSGAAHSPMGYEGEIAARSKINSGIPADAILVVTGGRTTHEEARQLAASLSRKGITRILLVTDGLHLRRAAKTFSRAGFEVIPAPVDDPNQAAGTPQGRLNLLRELAEETIALLYYKYRGHF